MKALPRLALALAILAALLLLAAGPGVRLGLWPFPTGFFVMRLAVFVGGAAFLIAMVAFLVPAARRGNTAMLLIALMLAAGAVAVPLDLQRRARAAPPINDVSTAGEHADLQPLVLRASAEEAFARARAAAQDMGWEIVSADPARGHIEAVATTFWFGFKDDVTVRVTPQGETSRIDVRSRSRVGRGDAGTNASRIRRYLAKLQA